MIRPHVPELAMPDGPDRDRLLALRALQNCGVIRVKIGKVPRGYQLLAREKRVRASRVPGDADRADCRLTETGLQMAAVALKGPN
jgi:hypothetical protein